MLLGCAANEVVVVNVTVAVLSPPTALVIESASKVAVTPPTMGVLTNAASLETSFNTAAVTV